MSASMLHEAISSAFYRIPFARFLGENETPGEEGGQTTWFVLGEDPHKRVRVHVVDGKTRVTVEAEWRNYHAEETLKGTKTWIVPKATVDPHGDSTSVVEGVLLIYRDVLEGVGVAGDIAKLAPETEERED